MRGVTGEEVVSACPISSEGGYWKGGFFSKVISVFFIITSDLIRNFEFRLLHRKDLAQISIRIYLITYLKIFFQL